MSTVADGDPACLSAEITDGWLLAKSGRKEFSNTNEDPSDATPRMTRTDPRRYMLGVTTMNSILDTEPIHPKASRSFLRYVPDAC
jgi:hypothetical protein